MRQPTPDPEKAAECVRESFRRRPPTVESDDEDKPSVTNKGKELTPLPKEAEPSDPNLTQLTSPEHPFASARDTTNLSTLRVSAAPAVAPRNKEAVALPARNSAPIKDPLVAERVLARTLKNQLSISTKELMAIFSKVRQKMWTMVTPKRLPAARGATFQFRAGDGPTVHPVEDLLSREELPKGVLRVKDLYETYLQGLAPGESPRLLNVA